ncbi:MAG: gamma-glutamyltransferase [Asticcacaulis sp.]
MRLGLACLTVSILSLSCPAPAKPVDTKPGPAQRTMTSAPHKGPMVSAANPLAARAGLQVLQAGGSAVDAAVAIQAVLSLVEPQSSGIGGGAFMMVYEARTGKVTAYNGRETAPKAATSALFLGEDGKPMRFAEAVISGRATGVPGVMAMLDMAHKRHGQRPWNTLFTPAIELGQNGFVVSPRLADYLAAGNFPQSKQPDVVRYFTRPDGQSYQAGDTLKNPAYAASLRVIAADGARALYKGILAEAIVRRVNDGPLGGAMTLEDLNDYKAKTEAPVCAPYRTYKVCVPAPPSSGVSLLQALKILEQTDIAQTGPRDPRGWLLLAEAQRLMYADRDYYVGDPDFVSVPVRGLLDPAYVRSRASLIGTISGPVPAAGKPPLGPQDKPVRNGADATMEPAGTSHFVVVDSHGNAVSMTTTVESLFGSGRMVGGFFLNNQLTDFSFSPTQEDGTPAANAVAGGKRPRSSMSPVVVLDRNDRLVAVLGSPGGSAILAYNLKSLVGIIDWKLSVQDAINLPNLVARGQSFGGETARFDPNIVKALEPMGIRLTPGRGENSGLHGIRILPDGSLQGGADPRREGVVLTGQRQSGLGGRKSNARRHRE